MKMFDEQGRLLVARTSGAGGTTINTTNNYLPIRQNATTFVDSIIHDVNPGAGLFDETIYVAGIIKPSAIVLENSYTLLDSNNTIVGPTTGLCRIESDDATPTNRIFTLQDGQQFFVEKKVMLEGTGAAKLVNTGNVQLSADWVPVVAGETLQLIWIGGGTSKWFEQWRYP